MGGQKVEPKMALVAEEHVDVMLFKLQMGTSVERLYVTIRDGVKAELATWLAQGGKVRRACSGAGGGWGLGAGMVDDGSGWGMEVGVGQAGRNGDSKNSNSTTPRRPIRFNSSLRTQV